MAASLKSPPPTTTPTSTFLSLDAASDYYDDASAVLGSSSGDATTAASTTTTTSSSSMKPPPNLLSLLEVAAAASFADEEKKESDTLVVKAPTTTTTTATTAKAMLSVLTPTAAAAAATVAGLGQVNAAPSIQSHSHPHPPSPQQQEEASGAVVDEHEEDGTMTDSHKVKPGHVGPGDSFPFKVFDMLEEATRLGEEHIISWVRNGTAFQIHDRDQFMKSYMTRYFHQTKYKSFQRQANLWKFEKYPVDPCDRHTIQRHWKNQNQLEDGHEKSSRKNSMDTSSNSCGSSVDLPPPPSSRDDRDPTIDSMPSLPPLPTPGGPGPFIRGCYFHPKFQRSKGRNCCYLLKRVNQTEQRRSRAAAVLQNATATDVVTTNPSRSGVSQNLSRQLKATTDTLSTSFVNRGSTHTVAASAASAAAGNVPFRKRKGRFNDGSHPSPSKDTTSSGKKKKPRKEQQTPKSKASAKGKTKKVPTQDVKSNDVGRLTMNSSLPLVSSHDTNSVKSDDDSTQVFSSRRDSINNITGGMTVDTSLRSVERQLMYPPLGSSPDGTLSQSEILIRQHRLDQERQLLLQQQQQQPLTTTTGPYMDSGAYPIDHPVMRHVRLQEERQRMEYLLQEQHKMDNLRQLAQREEERARELSRLDVMLRSRQQPVTMMATNGLDTTSEPASKKPKTQSDDNKLSSSEHMKCRQDDSVSFKVQVTNLPCTTSHEITSMRGLLDELLYPFIAQQQQAEMVHDGRHASLQSPQHERFSCTFSDDHCEQGTATALLGFQKLSQALGAYNILKTSFNSPTIKVNAVNFDPTRPNFDPTVTTRPESVTMDQYRLTDEVGTLRTGTMSGVIPTKLHHLTSNVRQSGMVPTGSSPDMLTSNIRQSGTMPTGPSVDMTTQRILSMMREERDAFEFKWQEESRQGVFLKNKLDETVALLRESTMEMTKSKAECQDLKATNAALLQELERSKRQVQELNAPLSVVKNTKDIAEDITNLSGLRKMTNE